MRKNYKKLFYLALLEICELTNCEISHILKNFGFTEKEIKKLRKKNSIFNNIM